MRSGSVAYECSSPPAAFDGNGEHRWLAAIRARPASPVLRELLGEHLQGTQREANGAIGVVARAAPVDHLAPALHVLFDPCGGVAACHLAECARHRIEPVSAWTALARSFDGQVVEHPCAFGHSTRSHREQGDQARAETASEWAQVFVVQDQIPGGPELEPSAEVAAE